MKRVISLALALILIFSLGVTAFAEETTAADGTGIDIAAATASPEATSEPAQTETPAAAATPSPTPASIVVGTAAPTPTPAAVTAVPVTPTPTATTSGTAQSRAVIGADLTADQVALVYQAFGIQQGSVTQLTVTNAEERSYLEGYVDSSIIGTRSISCVYVELLSSGAGMNVTTSNITWCTPEMYISALATAGITDARIIVAAPFEVSGTAALTGIYKAYEDMTGKKLDDVAKLVSTQELTITGELAQEIGSMDSTAIVSDLKLMLDETKNMTDDEIRSEIVQIAARYNVTLTDTQINQLITLCRSLEGLDADQLKARVEQVQDTLNKVSSAKTQVVGFVQTVKKVVTSVQSFFERIKDIIGLN